MKTVRIIGSTPIRAVGEQGADFIRRFGEVVGWADRAGWHGSLIGTSNLLIDPWLLAQLLLQRTGSLRPLIATQPIYEHPFAVANKAASLATLYDRGVDFNFVAGDHPRDRESLNDLVAHDERYARVEEYGAVIRQLLSSSTPTSFSGKYFTVKHLLLTQRPSAEVDFDFLMSGTSAAAREVASKLHACAVQYPSEPGKNKGNTVEGSGRRGIRVGIIARQTSGEAWDAAFQRFPPDAEGEAIRKYVAGASDSEWVRTLLEESAEQQNGAYWLSPFRRFQRVCPYLVGSESEVKALLREYLAAGYRTLLIDAIESEDEAFSIKQIVDAAAAL